MSINGFSSDHNNKTYKNPSYWRNNSGELDVFEASNYFSSAGSDQNPGLHFSNRQNIVPTRMSLDMPITRNPIIPPEFHHVGPDQKQPKLENKKHKEPSSPGGRLASFLNSLFNQTSLKKKKKSKPGKDFDDENAPGPGRRKRRSSISHFGIITSGANSAAGDNSRPGFRTPPPYADTPTKSYKAIPLFPSGKGGGGGPKTTMKDELCAEKKADEKTRAPGKNNSKNLDFRFIDGFRKFDDDGADSDSSSDLFDLPNHELDFYSSGLPVYETTHMDSIKLVGPISRATTV